MTDQKQMLMLSIREGFSAQGKEDVDLAMADFDTYEVLINLKTPGF